MADQFVNMRSALFLHSIGQAGFTVVAPPDDPAWAKKNGNFGGFSAYRVRDKIQVPVKKWTITYQPEHPDDWERHPDAFRALKMLGYRSVSPKGPVTVAPFRLNALFFAVDRNWINEFYHGRRTIQDWILFLEKREAAG